MSENFGLIRRGSHSQARYRKLIEQYSRHRAQQIQVENLDFVPIARTSHSILKYIDNINYYKQYEQQTEYYTPFEPDTDHLVCWLPMGGVDRVVQDVSSFPKRAILHGEAFNAMGIDTGFGGSTGIVFKGKGYVIIPPSNNMNVGAQNQGFTISIRIYPVDITQTPFNNNLNDMRNRRVVAHIDSIDAKHGYSITLNPTGRVLVTVKYQDEYFDFYTPQNIIEPVSLCTYPLDYYDLVVSFNPNAPTNEEGKIYINNTKFVMPTNDDRAILPTTENTIGGPTLICRSGTTPTAENGYTMTYKGMMQDFRFYKNKVLTDQEVTNLFNNKWTIYDIPFGQVALAGLIYISSLSGGFHDTGFDSVGFDTRP